MARFVRRPWWLRRSLRFRVTALAVAITLACLLGLALLAGRMLGPLLGASVEDELREVLGQAAGSVQAGALPQVSPGVEVRVLDTAGTPTDGRGTSPLRPSAIGPLKAGEPATTADPRVGPPVRWLGTVVSAPDGSQRLVVAGAGMTGMHDAVTGGSRWLVAVALVGAVLAGLATWLVVGSSLRPVARMRRAVRELPAGQRLPLPDARDDVAELAADFNTLLARQEAVNERLRRFTGDAAHELRSPVASIRVQSEVGVATSDADVARETLADVLAEAERLSALLDGLLALARSDAGEVGHGEPVELVSEARAALDRLSADAPASRVSGVAGHAWAHAAYAEVELVLANLLRNAARFAETQIVVSVLRTGQWVHVVVDDDGPGIAPEHRNRVFDRFYRVTQDRARSSGGTGLGLAMVAEAVRRRGGRVRAGESPEGGARIQVSWRASTR